MHYEGAVFLSHNWLKFLLRVNGRTSRLTKEITIVSARWCRKLSLKLTLLN